MLRAVPVMLNINTIKGTHHSKSNSENDQCISQDLVLTSDEIQKLITSRQNVLCVFHSFFLFSGQRMTHIISH